MVNLPPRAKREAKMVLANLSPRAEREAKGSFSPHLLEQSERFRDNGKSSTSTGARGLGVLVKLPPRAKREVESNF